MGGSRDRAFIGTIYTNILDWIPFEVEDADYDGFTYAVEVELLVENVATSITPRIRNITDSTTAVTGSAHALTTWGRQTLTFTPTVGKIYHLQLLKSNDTWGTWGIGWMTVKKT